MSNQFKPVFVLSGMSGTGKSCILEDSRLMGVKGLRSFNKFLLSVRFGYGQPTHKFLIMDMYMQVYHIRDFNRDTFRNEAWMLERCILDGYYFTTEVFGYKQTEQEINDMNHMLREYFKLLTDDGNKPLYIIDIVNKDRDWIAKNLHEEPTRENCWSKVDDYLESQDKYKCWYFTKLNELGIDYDTMHIEINDITNDFTPDYRRLWIYKNVILK